MSGQGEVIGHRENVIRAVLDLLSAERKLSDESASMTELMAREDALSVACRDLAESVDALPLASRPKGWVRR